MHGNEKMICAVPDGKVELWHDNSKKLETTSTGIETHGNITAHDLLPDSNAYRNIGTSSNKWNQIHGTTLYGDGSNLTGISTDLVGDTSPQLGGALDTNGKNINFGDSTSGSADDRLVLGNGQDMSIYHDPSIGNLSKKL